MFDMLHVSAANGVSHQLLREGKNNVRYYK